MYCNPLFLQAPSILEDVFYQGDLGSLQRNIPFGDLTSKIPSPPHIKVAVHRKCEARNSSR